MEKEMKAEERHELKTNELAQWILSLPQLIKENLQIIIYVSAAAVLILAAVFYYLYQKNVTAIKSEENLTRQISTLAQSKSQIVQSQSQGIDLSYNLIQNADELEVASQNIKSATAAAFALIKRGEALRMELHYRPTVVSKETLTNQINLAKASYEKAIYKAGGEPTLTAKAKYALGLCEEELGNFKEAEKIYHQITGDKNLEDTVGYAEARHRLAIMSDYEQPVTFKPAPKPPEPVAPTVVPPIPEVNIPLVLPPAEEKPAEANQAQK
jgi:tetratricopeptide (TPR) repeat protein